MYMHAVLKLKIKSITHKFVIRGHTQNEGDNVLSVIEKAIKKALKSGPIYKPSQYVSIIRSAKKTGTPYIVREMGYADFYDIKDLHDRYIGPSQQLLKHVKIGDIKVLKVEKSKPATLMYKTSYSDDSFKEANVAKPNLRRSKSSMNNEEFEPKRALTEKLPLSDKKKSDLLGLIQCKAIPTYYYNYYKSICE